MQPPLSVAAPLRIVRSFVARSGDVWAVLSKTRLCPIPSMKRRPAPGPNICTSCAMGSAPLVREIVVHGSERRSMMPTSPCKASRKLPTPASLQFRTLIEGARSCARYPFPLPTGTTPVALLASNGVELPTASAMPTQVASGSSRERRRPLMNCSPFASRVARLAERQDALRPLRSAAGLEFETRCEDGIACFAAGPYRPIRGDNHFLHRFVQWNDGAVVDLDTAAEG